MRSWGILCLSVFWTMFTQLSCYRRQAMSGSSSHHVLSPAFYPWIHSTPLLLMGSCVGGTALGTGGKLIKTNRVTDAKTFACRGGPAVWKLEPGSRGGSGSGWGLSDWLDNDCRNHICMLMAGLRGGETLPFACHFISLGLLRSRFLWI